jgi:2,3-bisphosphoglycerate-independent phosphoglycerate mutase
VARLPTFRALIGGAPTLERVGASATATLFPIDALLGIAGLPQSGTGHATLLTGENAPRMFGRHFGPWVPTALRPLLRERSVLRRAVVAGRRVAFANAYPSEVAAAGSLRGPAARSGPPLAAAGAGLLDRHAEALRRGDAVASEITNDAWRERLGRRDIPRITPRCAGVSLARIAAAHDLTLFAHYTTDTVGHRGTFADAVAAIERVDAFMSGVLDALPSDALLLVASDHGNLEDTRVGHTRNPALGLAHGPAHDHFAASVQSLTDVTPTILRLLCVDPE